MDRRNHLTSVGPWVFPALCLLCLLPGCASDSHCNVDNCSTIPPGAIPQPTGTFTHNYNQAQAFKAKMDDFVIYNYEWFLGGQELGPYGAFHIRQIIKRLPEVPFPVVIQPDTDVPADDERRAVIVEYLTRAGIPDADQRVVIGFPEAEGIYGEEGPPIFRQMVTPYNNEFGYTNNFQNLAGEFGAGGLLGGGVSGLGGFGGGFGGLGGFGGY
jgi:hypothetical protein